MDELFALFRTVDTFSDELEQAMWQRIRHETITKGDFLLRPGQVSNKMYFVCLGLIRGYSLKDDKDITTGFMPKGYHVISPVSFYTRQPSFEYLEAMTNTQLISMTYESVDYIYAAFPEYNKIGRILTEQYYVRAELRAHNLRLLSVEERYEAFMQNYRV